MQRLIFILVTTCLSSLLTGASPAGCNRSEVKDPGEKVIYYKLGETQVPIRILEFGNNPDIFCINLHDNEFTSVDAARVVLEKTGGTILKFDNDQERIIQFQYRGRKYAFDPNRMFSQAGIRATLEDLSHFDEAAGLEIEKFAERILSLIPDTAKYLIALHNNTDEAFSIRSYMKHGEYEKDARKVKHQSDEDVDDLVLTTDEKLFKKIADLGYNCILQDNKNATQDGSLSVWAGEQQRTYINLETEHGKTGKYISMLRDIIGILE